MSEEQNQERAIIADEQDVEYEIGHLDETQGKEAEEFALKVIKAAASLKMGKKSTEESSCAPSCRNITQKLI